MTAPVGSPPGNRLADEEIAGLLPAEVAGDQPSLSVGLQDFNFPNQPSLLTRVQVPAGPHDKALVVVPDQVVTGALTETARAYVCQRSGQQRVAVHAHESVRVRSPGHSGGAGPCRRRRPVRRPPPSPSKSPATVRRDLASQLRWDHGREVVVGVPPGLAVEPGQDANRSVGKHRKQVICLTARESTTDRGVSILPELVALAAAVWACPAAR